METLNFGLKFIPVSKIERNPKNPRGENVRANDAQFDYLKRSIKQFGLIVPLIVQEIKGGEDRYRLLDGERRFLALKELGIKKAPANIIRDEVDEDQAKNIMFHIHTNRVQWDAYQQCTALQPVYEILKNKFKDEESKIAQELVRLTSTNRRTINDRLNFLRWPERIKRYVYTEKPDLYWTVVEIEKGIIIPAEENFPEYFEKVPKDEVRELLLGKYLAGVAHAGTEARRVKYIVKTTKDKVKQHRYASDIFRRLVEDVNYTFEEAEEQFLSKFPGAGEELSLSYKKVHNQIVKLSTMLSEFNIILFGPMDQSKKDEFKDALEELEIAISSFKKEAEEYLGSN